MQRIYEQSHFDLGAFRQRVGMVAFEMRQSFDGSRDKLHRVPALLENAHETLNEVCHTIGLLADDPRAVWGTSTDHDD